MIMLNLSKTLQNKNDGKQLTQYLAVISATITVFSTGLYQGWGSPSIVKILSDEYPIDVTEDEASYITVIGALGHVIAGFLASFLSDRIGRKTTILGIAIPQTIAFTLIYFSDYSKVLLYVARVLGGMGDGAVFALIPCYIAEIVDADVRGTLGSFVTLTFTVGVLFINVVGSFLTIHHTAIVCLAFPLLFWLTFSAMPESPYYSLMKKDTQTARTSLQMLRRKQNVDKEMMQLSIDVERQMSEKGSFKDLFTIKSNRRAFLYVTALRFFQIYSGINAFQSYNQLLIQQSTDFSPVWGSSILLVGNMSMIVLSSWYMDKVGRKLMFVVSGGLCFVVLIANAIFLSIRDYTSIDTSSYSWMPLLIIFMYNICYSGGWGPGVNVVIGEIFSASIKAKAMSAASMVFAGSYISSIKLYQYTADNVGMSVPFYVFGTIMLFGMLFSAFILPETKGRSLETIQQELKGNKVPNDKNPS